MGLLLYILATILGVILFPLAFALAFFKYFFRRHIGDALQSINDKFMVMAIAFDQYGNIVCAELFNATLVSKASTIPFGNYGETISSVVGKNRKAGTLTAVGRVLAAILHKLNDPQLT